MCTYAPIPVTYATCTSPLLTCHLRRVSHLLTCHLCQRRLSPPHLSHAPPPSSPVTCALICASPTSRLPHLCLPPEHAVLTSPTPPTSAGRPPTHAPPTSPGLLAPPSPAAIRGPPSRCYTPATMSSRAGCHYRPAPTSSGSLQECTVILQPVACQHPVLEHPLLHRRSSSWMAGYGVMEETISL